MSLICIKCGREYDDEGWDPMGGDCPRVRDSETGELITPESSEGE